jgi:hypothetical protein
MSQMVLSLAVVTLGKNEMIDVVAGFTSNLALVSRTAVGTLCFASVRPTSLSFHRSRYEHANRTHPRWCGQLSPVFSCLMAYEVLACQDWCSLWHFVLVFLSVEVLSPSPSVWAVMIVPFISGQLKVSSVRARLDKVVAMGQQRGA